MAVNIHQGCSLEAMKSMKDNQYDLAVVDPPYGLNMAQAFNQNANRNCKGWGQYEPKEWDTNVPSQEYFDQLFRVSKNQIIWGGNYFIDKIKIPSQGWLVWNKCQRNFTLADGELAWTSFDKGLRIFDYSRGSAVTENRKTGGMWHPTKKPVALYHWIYEKYASPGMKILDTHLGSGSSAIAAWDCGLDFDGWELDVEYHEAAVARFQEHTRQIRLF